MTTQESTNYAVTTVEVQCRWLTTELWIENHTYTSSATAAKKNRAAEKTIEGDSEREKPSKSNTSYIRAFYS